MVGVFLEVVADGEVAELGCVAVPADGMAPGPVSGRHRAMSSAMRMPSPVLKRVPRIFANSQPGPRYRVRISLFAWKPPAASTTHFALTSTVRPSCLTRMPLTPSSSAMSESARAL